MGNYKEDTNHNLGSAIFIILFSLFALISLSKSESQTSVSLGYSLQHEVGFRNSPIHLDATAYEAVSLTDLYKNCLLTSLNLLSFHYRVFNYNHRTIQDFTNSQRTRLVIEPLLLWRLYHPLAVSGREAFPVLS